MIRNWRSWVLIVLLVGPVLAYIGFGTLWLYQRGWLLAAGIFWVLAGIAFGYLAARWTKSQRTLLPPIDWDAPQTFAKIDRDAWLLVEKEADQGDAVVLERLTEFDIYIDTGRRLAKTLADHYHPLSTDPIERVPVVDVLTALELAAEDLAHLCRQVPGGDMLTPAHWKKAVTVAGYIQRANDIYSYLLPVFSPVTGLVRLGTQQLMVKPAWKNMQQNLLRWFFRAYVNRLGTHLIELYSGRLTIGAEQYRRITRRGQKAPRGADGEIPPLKIAVAGARDTGKSRLIALIREARAGDPTLLRARLAGMGLDEIAFEHWQAAEWVEIPGYTRNVQGESARDRSTRREAVEAAVDADFVVLIVDLRLDTEVADAAFAQAWDRWFVEHPASELPPAVAVLAGVDDPKLGGDWKPPYDWDVGKGEREVATRAKLASLRSTLPPSFSELIPVGLSEQTPFGVTELLMPKLITLINRAERAGLIRHLRRLSSQSKARRLVEQVGTHGRSIWNNIRSGRRVPTDASKR